MGDRVPTRGTGCGSPLLDFDRVEGLTEVVDPAEIFQGVLVGLAHEAGLDHRKDNPAEVVGAADPPPPEDGKRQEAVLTDRKVAEAEAELLSGDVAAFVGRLLFAGAFTVN